MEVAGSYLLLERELKKLVVDERYSVATRIAWRQKVLIRCKYVAQ
jgi:hypothetical protein